MNTATLRTPGAQTDQLAARSGRIGKPFLLRKDAIRSWPRPESGLTLRVEAGCAWVTQEGVPEDVILRAGEGFTASGRGRLIVQSLSPELRLTRAVAAR